MTDELNARLERGRAAYGHQFGALPDDAEARLGEVVGRRMAHEAVLAAGGVWGDGSLSTRDRSVAVVAALVALGGSEARLRGHLGLALDNGLSPDGLEELLTLLALYVGYPRASVAMEVLRTLLVSRPSAHTATS